MVGKILGVIGVLFGGSVQLNELALREEPAPPSRFGPTDATLPNPRCDTPLSIGAGATLEVTAQAFVDDEPVGSAFLTGQRSGTDGACHERPHIPALPLPILSD